MQQIKVYIAAKLEHAPMLAALNYDGFHINARWIEMADSGRKRLKPVTHWQTENFDDIVAAHFFVLYVEPSDHLKGAIGETFYAMAHGKKCWIAGNGSPVTVKPAGATDPIEVPHKDVLPWGNFRSQIRMVDTLDVAFLQMRQIAWPAGVKNDNGVTLPPAEF